MSSDEEPSRSERLRRRRESRREQRSEPDESGDPSDASESSKPAEASKPSKMSETAEPTESSEPSENTVKEEQVGTYMYLPESQKREVGRLYNVLKAEYEYEFDDEFEKNRHFYPLLIQYGLEGLDSLEASDLRSRLDSI